MPCRVSHFEIQSSEPEKTAKFYTTVYRNSQPRGGQCVIGNVLDGTLVTPGVLASALLK